MKLLSLVIPLCLFLGAIFFVFHNHNDRTVFLDFPSIGSPSSPVTMVVFESIDCTSCDFFNTNSFPFLKKNYIDEGILRYTVVLISTENTSQETLLSCYCQSDHFSKFLDAMVNKTKEIPPNCNLEKSNTLILKAQMLEDEYMPEVIETPFVIINGKRLHDLSLSAITQRINECLKQKPPLAISMPAGS